MNKQLTAAALLLALISGGALAADRSEACPYTAAELNTALGFAVDEGQGSEMPYPGGKILSCQYRGKGKASFAMTQMRTAKPSDAQQVAKGLQGQAIAGDSDGAIWVTTMGNANSISLSYVRGATHSEATVNGINSRNDAEAKPIRERLQKLRRVP